ncbi:MAG: hypothetical protein M8352_01925 [ANME-2 cluster archaeon]|nr:hypothetical protein [ANME-2 cluster archaeon]MDF1530846.1 hypothetical protein [ANME-2 cluster archaeon]
MLCVEELCGIVEVMGVASDGEIIEVVQELAYMRDEDMPVPDDLQDLLKSALRSHWLETIPRTAVCNGPKGELFFIAGPAAFGMVPAELSEIMDIIEFEGCRSIDWEIVASNITSNLSRLVERLEIMVEDAADGAVTLDTAEALYSNLFNMYYDYDFWLPDGLPGIGIALEKVSSRLNTFKEGK